MNPESKMSKLAAMTQSCQTDSQARVRLSTLFDENTFVELDLFAGAADTGSGVVIGYGYVGDTMAYAFSQDVAVDSGALTTVVAKKIKKVYELAAKTGCPVIGIYDSMGAKLSESNDMLAGYAEILSLSNEVSGVVPQIAVIAGVCAGTSAMMACGADLVVMVKDAELFLNAPFVTTAQGGPSDAGTAAFVAKAGVTSIVEDTQEDALKAVAKILSYLPQNNISPAPLFETAGNAAGASKLAAITETDGLDGLSVIENIADTDSVIELQAAYATGVVTAFGLVSGATVGFVATNEAADEYTANACDKAAKFIRFCDAFNLPVVQLINTKGFAVSACPKLIKSAARLAHAYAEATVPKINVLVGQAIGAAYIATSAADTVLAWPSAAISAMGLEAYVEFTAHDKLVGTKNLEADRKALVEEYVEAEAGAFKAAERGFVDQVIAPADTRQHIIQAIEMLAGKRVTTMPKKHTTAII